MTRGLSDRPLDPFGCIGVNEMELYREGLSDRPLKPLRLHEDVG
jgi:hypothetical protein